MGINRTRVENRWDVTQAAFASPLDECVYGSRLLGAEVNLVLHGGGNTSVKTIIRDIYGTDTEVMYVKGSGWDLASIELAGFTPLRIERLRSLIAVERLTDAQMMNELRLSSLDASAPDPSVESLLHALLPAAAVMHSHADAIIAMTNQPDGERRIRELFGDRLVVVPYVMPGFDLARKALEVWGSESHAGSLGMVLLNHGLFTVGDSTKVAYDRHIALIGEAEDYIYTRVGERLLAPRPDLGTISPEMAKEISDLRAVVSDIAGRPMIVKRYADEQVAGYVGRSDLGQVAAQGPLTPDHVIRTKRVPLIGRGVHDYAEEYVNYVAGNRGRRHGSIQTLTGEPRVILDREIGMLTVGPTAKEAVIASDIYHHTIGVIEQADAMSGYQALPAGDIFDVEYWDLEQAKLAREKNALPFTGEVALVTGAASGIGRACAAAMLAAGAAVIGIDVSGSVSEAFTGPAWLGLECDVTDDVALKQAVLSGVECFGGIDMLIPAAGIFAKSASIAEIDLDSWRRSMDVNAGSIAALMKFTHPFLRTAPRGGRVVLIASKNVGAPGPGAASYSSSKTAAAQLARVAALEWAPDGIRVNMVHPDAVFDTALWSPALLAERAAKYGMTEEAYRKRNLLGTEVTSATVALVVRDLCTDAFRCTTGGQVPIDGGNDRII